MIATLEGSQLAPRKHSRFRMIGRGPHLLVLSGPTGQWKETFDSLSERFTLVIPSFSQQVLEKQQGSPEPMRYIVSLLDELRLDRVAILTHSVSSWIAVRLASHYPSRVKKLILVSVPSAVRERDGFDRLYRQLSQQDYSSARQDASFSYEQLCPKHEDLVGAKRVPEGVPYLIVTGDRDPFFCSQHLAQWLPQNHDGRDSIQVMSFAGHFPMRDNPRHFAALIREFLQVSEVSTACVRSA